MATPGFTIPNAADAAFERQAGIYETDVDAIAAGFAGTCVVSGCAVTPQGSPDMTVAVAAGVIMVDGAAASVTAGNVTITAAHATLDRIDLVVADSAGTKSVTVGTPGVGGAGGDVVPPAIPANSVLLAMVYVPATDTAIGATQIVDKRVIRSLLFGKGTVAAPSISFAADPDTGLYWTDANGMAFSLGGVQGPRIRAGGWIYFPANKGVLLGDGSAADPVITFENDGDTGLYRSASDHLRVTLGGVATVGFLKSGTDYYLFPVTDNVVRLGDTGQGWKQIFLGVGSETSPSITFSGDTNTGFYNAAADQVAVTLGGTQSFRWNSANYYPVADNVVDLGHASNRWQDVYATNATIQTSDEAEKDLVAACDRGLDFIRAIEPIVFTWKDGVRPHYGLNATQVKEVIDADGKDFAGYVDPAVNAETAVNPHEGPAPADVDAEEWEAERALFEERRQGLLGAPKGLRYAEFIPPLIKAIQEQQTIIVQLSERVAALEGK